MKPIDIVLLIIIIVVFIFAVASAVKKFRSGKCCGDCSCCNDCCTKTQQRIK